MKQFILAALVSLVCFSCQNEFPEPMATGTLRLGTFETAATANETISRAIDADLIVEIWKNGEIFHHEGQTYRFTNGNFPSTITLPVGQYLVKAFNQAHQEESAWTNSDLGSAVYYQESDVVVTENAVADISMRVPMTNIGVTFTLPEEFNQSFSEYIFTVSEDDSQAGMRTVAVKKVETIYLKSGKFTVTLQAKNIDNETVSTSLTHQEVTPGTVYSIAYKVASTNEVAFALYDSNH